MLAQGLVLWAVDPDCSENSKVVLEVTARFPIKIPKPLIVINIASELMCKIENTPPAGKNQKCHSHNAIHTPARQPLFSLRRMPSLLGCGGIRSPR
jgi:hypothetical protein